MKGRFLTRFKMGQKCGAPDLWQIVPEYSSPFRKYSGKCWRITGYTQAHAGLGDHWYIKKTWKLAFFLLFDAIFECLSLLMFMNNRSTFNCTEWTFCYSAGSGSHSGSVLRNPRVNYYSHCERVFEETKTTLHLNVSVIPWCVLLSVHHVWVTTNKSQTTNVCVCVWQCLVTLSGYMYFGYWPPLTWYWQTGLDFSCCDNLGCLCPGSADEQLRRRARGALLKLLLVGVSCV